MNKLSVLITAHNEDWRELQDTVSSIRMTAGDKVDIIVVDDASQVPITLEDSSAKLVRTDYRCGVGPARHLAALHADSEYLLITDAHMRFEAGWLETALARIRDRPYTIHCASCVALAPGQMDIGKAKTVYSGARMNIFGADPNKHGVTQIWEGVWLPKTDGDDFAISCIMGACYFIPTDWFFHLGGLNLLRGWGSDEPYLSLKCWLAGGDCRVMKSVRIGHQFRDVSPYRTETWKLIYNKMLIGMTCLPMDQAMKIIRLFSGGRELIQAKDRLFDDNNVIACERAYLQSIFKRSFEWYCGYFGLTFPS